MASKLFVFNVPYLITLWKRTWLSAFCKHDTDILWDADPTKRVCLTTMAKYDTVLVPSTGLDDGLALSIAPTPLWRTEADDGVVSYPRRSTASGPARMRPPQHVDAGVVPNLGWICKFVNGSCCRPCRTSLSNVWGKS